MNLGDGLKLETEVLDGRPRLILAASDKSKPAMKMGNKARAPKQALRTRHAGHVLRSTQNACIKQENVAKPRSDSSLSMTKGEKLQVAKHSSHEATTKGPSLIFQRDGTNRYPDSEDPNVVKKAKQKPQTPSVSGEDLTSLVCLTQEQLQQILMIVKEGTRSISETHNEKQEEMDTNEASEENNVASLQKDCEVSSVPDEGNCDSSRKQEAHPQPGQKVIKDSWKPADIFSTLGEREGEKALLEFKKIQWKKELDEQVALKKKLKETLEGEGGYFWAEPGNNKTHKEKVETADPDQTVFPADSVNATEENCACTAALATEADEVPLNVSRAPAGQSSDFSSSDFPADSCTAFVFREAVPQERPFSALKHEQQKKWLEELDKQKEEAKLRKIEEKLNLSKAEEHDRWAMHFDSFKNHLNANAQHPLNGMHKKQPESLCLSPDPKELTAFIHPFSPAALGNNLMPLKVGNAEKAAKNGALEQSQKVSFLRSMTALLDPAQIEERDRRRQKQLEHQKAIMAQVEEKRKKKQLEEEKRKWEEQQEELRLAREKEQLQKQFEEEMLKQKQKEELATLKTKELYQTMEKAQELAQRLKQEQHIPDVAQNAHDISKVQNNPGGGDTQCENCHSGISHQSNNFCDDVKSHSEQQVSPRKDTAVQTDYFNTAAYTESAEERTVCCESPDISIEYKETSNSKKYQKEMQYIDKNKISGKETGGTYSDLYDQYARKERQIKSSEKYSKRPDWNINKPGKRYIPASERYPKQLQKQREENKVRRQMELLQLMERNTPGHLWARKGGCLDRSPSPREETAVRNKGHRVRKEEQFYKNHVNEERSESPPVPAVKNRLLQVQQRQIHASNFLVHNNSSRREKSIKADAEQSSPPPVPEAGRPPSAQFIPYVRTKEVYYLDPEAPVTRPSTHDPQYRQFHDSYQMPRQIFSSDHVRDPLLNPDVVRERQQAILKGLSKLRQGLLQKQKELENTLIPTVAQENFIPPF
ncbi:coiled-coil domain-containing protein 66 isoform X1 [Corapipo altera]|uniref:coiled-coil domain-containing protein 66 isoform X1 n=2 Tax=Corapipo altera TaxID=415028 RepID=UPI000FD62950|nr:coiled-coil domain-containing protein 66 isoform X1 [Corapipo altera]XP_027496642.1 coiled-coil domain-containing protein 66 isoform X1 [Corapipo altera]XP_027496643.1 coiled-coil domain-containing protein 66 isoform X1 [Corapipo altera]